MTLTRLLAGSALAALMSATAMAADVTIRLMHVDPSEKTLALYNSAVERFQQQNPNVAVEIQYMENEAYKQKLTTLLQSPDRPNIIYSWGGGVLREQVEAGVIEDISEAMGGELGSFFAPTTIQAYSIDGKAYGVPNRMQVNGFYYNKDLFAQAGVDAEAIQTWDQLLDAVKALQAAGIQPTLIGGKDKWPLGAYLGSLVVKAGGEQGYLDSINGENGGFASPAYVTAAEKLKELIDLEPFQTGWLGATNSQMAGQFGDGKAAMFLSVNSFLNTMAVNAADKIGIPDDKLGWFPFPAIEGGAGEADLVGSLNGWLVTKDSPPETLEFLEILSSPEVQLPAAEQGLFIPATVGAHAGITRPLLLEALSVVDEAGFYQISYDQALGPQVGPTFNDLAVELAAGRVSPTDFGARLQDAWTRAYGN